MSNDISTRDDLVRILPLGGAGEIGMNLTILEHQGRILLLDCGLMFCSHEFPGADILVPDISWLQQRREAICGIAITHGHEDHIGALPFVLHELNNPDIFATPFTLEFIRARLAAGGGKSGAKLHRIEPRETFSCGPFTLEAFSVAHSIPGAVGLAIQTSAGTILHTGDFKLDSAPTDGVKTDLATIARYADNGILALLADSTNIERPGYSGSEGCLRPEFERIMKSCSGLVYFTTFSSHIHRWQIAIDAAERSGRKIILQGRGVTSSINIARRTGALRLDSATMVEPDPGLEQFQRSQLCVLAGGCQGEKNSAMHRIAAGAHPHLDVHAEDCAIISARSIPGNEVQLNALLNHLYRNQARVYTGAQANIHVSGHACREELAQLLCLAQPQYFIPLHGETRHLHQHAELARQCGVRQQNCLVIEDGEALVLSRNGCTHEPKIICNPRPLDLRAMAQITHEQIKLRRQMGHGGIVIIAIGMDQTYGRITVKPVIHFHGISKNAHVADMLEQIKTATTLLVAEECAQASQSAHTADKSLNEAIVNHGGRICKKMLGYRPLVIPIIFETA